jgi:ATP-dependent DNA ligase
VRRPEPDCLAAREASRGSVGYEGYVAKDEASVYEGGATRRWFKSTGRPTSGPLAA